MSEQGLTTYEWDKLDREVDEIIQDIELIDKFHPGYNSILDLKNSRLAEIEALIDESIAIKKKGIKQGLRLV